MRLIVWNSFGSKWDVMYNFFVQPELEHQNDDVIGLIVEAGWPPWMIGGIPVALDNIYGINEGSDRYDEQGALLSACCEAIRTGWRSHAYWVPWVKKLADVEKGIASNSRCSMGAMVFPMQGSKMKVGKAVRLVDRTLKRPVISIPIKVGREVVATVMLVHLISSRGNHPVAQRELNYLTSAVPQMIPEGTMAIVVGDFNINLIAITPNIPLDWDFLALHPMVATQQKGGMLDWALIYNPQRVDLTTETAAVVQRYKSGANGSDHSVLQFDVDWDVD